MYTITYRVYREGDEHGIVKLRKEVAGRDMSLDEWNWKFKGQGNKKVYSVVMDEETHGIIGHCGGTPLRMIYFGKEIKGVVGSNAMIQRNFRGFVRFKKLQTTFAEEALKDSVSFIYGFPTEKTFMLPAEKLNIWERLEDIHEYSKDVKPAKRAGQLLYTLFPMEFDDERINGLWEDAKDQFGLSIIKDTDYLTWRYNNHPVFQYELWGLKKRYSGKLLAVAVLKKGQPDILLIMDVVSRNDLLPVLLSTIESLASSLGKKRICLYMPHIFDALLKRGDFSSSPTGGSIARINHPRILSKNDIDEKFFYTMGDTDYL